VCVTACECTHSHDYLFVHIDSVTACVCAQCDSVPACVYVSVHRDNATVDVCVVHSHAVTRLCVHDCVCISDSATLAHDSVYTTVCVCSMWLRVCVTQSPQSRPHSRVTVTVTVTVWYTFPQSHDFAYVHSDSVRRHIDTVSHDCVYAPVYLYTVRLWLRVCG